ncbi:MAG TPA: hypothetical protein VGO30_16135 [Mycobacterium sp.]|jgi:hypothetical protein|nr:hypothetical protein [Mycobacterium sp.]
MSELVLAPQQAQEFAPHESIGTGAVVEGSAPVLITEQEVMFATAAVLPRQRAADTRWWTAIGRRTPRIYPPRRVGYLEEASMRREMYRL